MRSKKHLILIALALALGAVVATAKPPHGGWKGDNPCQGFFEAPFLSVGGYGNNSSSEGKLCYWEGNTSIVHAKVEIEPVPLNQTWCIYLADAQDLLELIATDHAFPHLIGTDNDGNDEIFLDQHICDGNCSSEELAGPWVLPAFWVTALGNTSTCGGKTFDNESLEFLTGFWIP